MESDKKIVYLSGAPRISTSPDSENTAARNHILEVCHAFESLGYSTALYILGNSLPKKMTGKGSEGIANKTVIHRILTDLFRLLLVFKNRQTALSYFGQDVCLVYERFALMQSVGWAFKKKGVPWILETNAILSDEAYFESKTLYLRGISERLEKWAYKKCDLLVTISDSLKESIIRKYGINPEKIYVMQNGVNTSVFKPMGSGSKPDTFVIGYVGSVVEWQSLELLIQAFSELKDQLVRSRIMIVGDGSELRKLKQYVIDNDLSDLVEFTGRVSPGEVPKLIEEFSIGYCNPHHISDSTSEVFNSPMKLYEYLAMGKPVIAQNNYDLTQLNGADNFLFRLDGYDLENLKNGIMHFFNQKENLARLGQVAMKEVQENHSWNSRVSGMMDYFKINC